MNYDFDNLLPLIDNYQEAKKELDNTPDCTLDDTTFKAYMSTRNTLNVAFRKAVHAALDAGKPSDCVNW